MRLTMIFKRGHGKFTIPTSAVISLEETCFLETIANEGLGWDVRILQSGVTKCHHLSPSWNQRY